MSIKNKKHVRILWFALTFWLAACQPGVPVEPAIESSRLSPTPYATASIPPLTPTQTTTQTETPLASTPTMSPTAFQAEIDQPKANADVVFVRMVQEAAGSWTFHVTVSHPDTGWEDYADGWDVVLPGGTVLKSHPEDVFTRLLLHPHTDEQPFTRSQSGLQIPEGVTQVQVRAHDLVDGYGGQEITIDLSQETGPGYEIEH